MAEAEGSWEGGLDAPIEGWVGALQALAPVLTGAHCTFILIHLAPLAAVAWGHTQVGVRSQGVTKQHPSTAARPAQGQAGTTAQIWSRTFRGRDTLRG